MARILTTRQLVCVHKIISVVYDHGFAAVTLPSSLTPLMSLLGVLADPPAVGWVNSLMVFAPLLLPGWGLSSHCPKPKDEVGNPKTQRFPWSLTRDDWLEPQKSDLKEDMLAGF